MHLDPLEPGPVIWDLGEIQGVPPAMALMQSARAQERFPRNVQHLPRTTLFTFLVSTQSILR